MIWIMTLCTIGLIMNLLVVTHVNHRSPKRVQIKALASIGFVAVGIATALQHPGNMQYNLMILVSLGFSLMGDIFLGLADYSAVHSLNKKFVLGVASFAVAHVVYAALFGQMSGWHIWDVLIPIVMVGITYMLSKLPPFDFKGCLKFVLPYTFILGIMLMKALALDSVMIKVAAILFVFSDFLLIFKYFYNKSKPWMTVLNLLSYYSAQLIFALSILTIS